MSRKLRDETLSFLNIFRKCNTMQCSTYVICELLIMSMIWGIFSQRDIRIVIKNLGKAHCEIAALQRNTRWIWMNKETVQQIKKRGWDICRSQRLTLRSNTWKFPNSIIGPELLVHFGNKKNEGKMKQILIQRIKLYSVSHLHHRSVRWSVLWHSNSVNSLGTFWIIVVQVCDIYSNRCHSLTLFRRLSLLCEHLRFQIKSCRFEVAKTLHRR